MSNPALAAVLRPELPALVDELVAGNAEGFDPAVLRMGLEEALRGFVEEVETGRRARGRRLFVNFGRTEMRAGRPLEALLGAYRRVGRLSWRRFAAAGRAAGVAPEVLHELAEAIFAWVDELSDQSAAGYAQESRVSAGAAQARRERVVRLLLADPPAAAAEVEAAALQAPWELPVALACCAVADEQGRLLAALGGAGDLLAAPAGDALCVVAPAAALDVLARTLQRRELAAALGPVVPWREASRSWARAAALHSLLPRGLTPGEGAGVRGLTPGEDGRGLTPGAMGLVRAEDHPELLLLAADPALTEELRAAALAPLDGLTAGQRARFAATLRAWLAHRGALKEVAAELGIHPQTVRYRVRRLRELFGPALEDPDARLRLELALRADALA